MNLHHVKDARDKLVQSIDERFDFLETNHLFGVTSLLDPNFGKYWLKGGRELESWIEKLAYLRDWETENLTPSSIVASSCKPISTSLLILHDHADDSTDQEDCKIGTVRKLLQSMPKPNGSCIDTLGFWKIHEKAHPELAKLARKLLSIPAGSDAVERAFSQTGYIVRQHRRNLSDRNCERLFFIKNNTKYLSVV